MDRPTMRLAGIVLGTPDVKALSEFYMRLLGWELEHDLLPGWRKLSAPAGPGLSFQLEPDHVAPEWPQTAGHQQMQLHLDIEVQDLEVAVAWAQECGAKLYEFQPQDDVRVMQDPVGHPFCLFLPDA